jgi:epoxyqueuosine reductase
MNILSYSELPEKIIEKAKSLGASIAGIASVESLKNSPSHQIYPIIGMNLKKHFENVKDSETIDEVAWPVDALSVVIIGVEHNIKEPELDLWDGRGTPGNRVLVRINRQLSEWMETTFSIKTYKLPYFVEKGGIFLKDAAVMAGLGCVGKNNLVITPEYGPRVRFRALLMDYEVKVTGPIEYNPCEDCDQPCRNFCPINAFQNTVYSHDKVGQSILPGINGTYDRVTCNMKMEKDIEDAVMKAPILDDEKKEIWSAINEFEEGIKVPLKNDFKSNYSVKYCRICELTCPAGK